LPAKGSTGQKVIVPPLRVRYVADVAEPVCGYHEWARGQVSRARERAQLRAAKAMLSSSP
jgi:isobutyryl-CoA mutase